MPRAGKVFDTVARTLGAVGSLATVALGALVWGFNSREAVVSSRLENLEKQSEKLAFQLDKQSEKMDKQIDKLAFQLETSTNRLAGDLGRLSGDLGAWSRTFSELIDSIHTLAALQPSKAGNSGAHVSNVLKVFQLLARLPPPACAVLWHVWVRGLC